MEYDDDLTFDDLDFDFEEEECSNTSSSVEHTSTDLCNSSTSSSSSCSSDDLDILQSFLIDDNVAAKKKRKRGVNKKKLYAQMMMLTGRPRIMKNDIRNIYFSMYANVVNSCDPNFLFSFLTAYAIPTVTMTKIVFKQNTPKIVEVKGPRLFSIYQSIIMQSFPDSYMRFTDIQIRQRSDTKRSIVYAKFEGGGTMLYKYPMPEIMEDCIKHHRGNLQIEQDVPFYTAVDDTINGQALPKYTYQVDNNNDKIQDVDVGDSNNIDGHGALPAISFDLVAAHRARNNGILPPSCKNAFIGSGCLVFYLNEEKQIEMVEQHNTFLQISKNSDERK